MDDPRDSKCPLIAYTSPQTERAIRRYRDRMAGRPIPHLVKRKETP